MDERNNQRERKKRVLRQSMIDTATVQTEEEGQDYERKLKEHRRKKRSIILILVLALALLVFFIWNYMKNKTFTSYKTINEVSVAEGSTSEYVSYRDGVIKYSKDGMSYLNSAGETVWNQAYDMKDPVVAVCGDFVAAADRMGYALCICGSDGGTGAAATTLPLTRISISEQGVLAVILEDSTSSYITLYDKSGAKLDIEIKALLDKSGYPVDIALSPNGQIMAVAYVYLNQGTMLNQVVFYNFNEEGKEYVDRVVGGFKEYKETMIGEIDFLSDEVACVFADSQIDFYSLKKSDEPSLLKSCPVETEMQSVFSGEGYGGILTASKDGDTDETLTVYSASGDTIFTKTIPFHCVRAEFSKNGVLLYDESQCMLLNKRGKVRYQGELDGSIVKLVQLSDGDFMQIGETSIKRVTLR